MTPRYSAEERAALSVARKIKRNTRPKAAPKTKIVLPPRRKLTPKEKAEIHAAHDGKCHVCGADLPITGPEVQYDHVLERALKADDSPEAFAPICTVPCHAEKTAKFLTTLAHVDRMGAKERGEIRPKGTIRSAGFRNVSRPMRSR
jgi:5-methylcytosine-specific restriction endonuclease McrA